MKMAAKKATEENSRLLLIRVLGRWLLWDRQTNYITMTKEWGHASGVPAGA